MSNTPVSDSKAIRRGEPIYKHGLTLYPVLMTNYEEYAAAKSVLLLRQSTLPAQYAAMPFLNALFEMDYESILQTGKPVGHLFRLLLILMLALRLPREELESAVRLETEGERTLKAILIRQGDETAKITPANFVQIRRIIAEQNGDMLPDESDNAELIQAERDFADLRSEPLDYDIDSMIDSVAYNSHVSHDEIMGWTIRQFEIRRATIRRDKLFTIYTQAEMSGMVTFQKGNPYPSYEFDRQKGDLEVLIPEHEIRAKYGKVADIRTQE